MKTKQVNSEDVEIGDVIYMGDKQRKVIGKCQFTFQNKTLHRFEYPNDMTWTAQVGTKVDILS